MIFNGQNPKNILEEEVDDTLDSLYKSTININSLKNPNIKPSHTLKSSDFSLDKELAQSKVVININEIDDGNKYLKNRVWDSSDDNKIEFIENKVEKIYKELNQDKLDDLVRQINRVKLENFYNNFRPRINDKTIGSVSSLDFLIETTYNCVDSHYDIMITDREQLSPNIYKFRSVSGDGDCFYRGLIFSLMENIVLTNNIMLMKELLILYHEKINLKNPLLKDKEYLYVFHQMNIQIVANIIYILINIMETDIEKAYRTLLKIFLFCPDFDFGIIYFTRYLIYEYISENQDKIYSREFQVEIGTLLPEDFVAEKGDKNEYFYENYFSMQLMNPKTFAEKIVLYICPFVFNINMNILIYDFGINGAPSFIEEKKFFSEYKNNSLIQINLLFRKAHYDIYYKQKYFEEYKDFFNILKNTKEDIKIINKKIENKDNNQENEKEVKEEKKVKELKEEKEEKEEHILDLINEEKNIPDNKENTLLCFECKKPYYELNDFALCKNCLLNNLTTALLGVYIDYIQKKDVNNLNNPSENFTLLLKQSYCTISEIQKNISVYEAINNSNIKIKDLLLSIRKKLCLYCAENLKSDSDYFIKLPCECRICSKNCFLNYIKMMKRYITLNDNPNNENYAKYINFIKCFCGFTYHSLDVLEMIQEMEKRKLDEEKELYQEYIKNMWNWRCMLCHKSFRINKKSYRFYFDTDKIDKKLLKSKKDLKHLICGDCYKENINQLEDKYIYCRICEFEHKMDKIIEVNKDNEDGGCLIF